MLRLKPDRHEQIRTERDRDLHEVSRSFAAQGRKGLVDLQRVSDRTAQRTRHRGDPRGRADASGRREIHHGLPELSPAIDVREKRTAPGFDVEDQRIDVLGHLLGNDRTRDQRERFDKLHPVAQRIEHAVTRRNRPRLSADHAASLAEHALDGRLVQAGANAGDGLELVERTAGVAQAAARYHRHDAAKRCQRGREGQAHLVTNPAR